MTLYRPDRVFEDTSAPFVCVEHQALPIEEENIEEHDGEMTFGCLRGGETRCLARIQQARTNVLVGTERRYALCACRNVRKLVDDLVDLVVCDHLSFKDYATDGCRSCRMPCFLEAL